jgi:carbonic anhydrase/acetyltransferase-like protein (isoleucine patch superfamily)
MIRDIEHGARTPNVHPGAYVDPSAQVIGEVEIGEGSSVWPLALVRGDQSYIRIGRNTNIQDHCVCHVEPGMPLVIGDNVTLGHRAVVHGCTIKDNVRIGIGAIVLSGAVVEEWAQVPAGTLVMGAPAKPVRQMSPEELEDVLWNTNWPRA